ncbi:uncharacterized protein LOC119929900 isoform X2 [Tachyglossus aculeatus]|uniref:uncharacterized protein LOC119929900 isoform X2 n=1 Tax=Tachyglossus aculeatus TaxID=9261 RepID=UPI0018F3BB41|nr:uncharacterized protein LOC119929900 isoform X2 [Tachyglossus aculeatus]
MATDSEAPKGSPDEELNDLLKEFDEVIQDFDNGSACQYEEHLEELKRQNACSVYDSGIDELETKLGDTRDLENYIADLDKVLADM